MKNEITSKRERLAWIDFLRGIAIIFVIYGHCKPESKLFFDLTSPIKMPLFFILSGFLFNTKDNNPKNYLLGVWNKLVIPWICLSVLALIVSFVGMLTRMEPNAIANRIIGIVIGKEHWFMPCFILSSIIHFLFRIIIKEELKIVIGSIICYLTGLWLYSHHWLNVFMINRAIHVQLFFCIGYLLYKHFTIITKYSKTVSIAGLICYLFIAIFYYFANIKSFDVHMLIYPNLLICTLLIIVGNITLFSYFSTKRIFPKWILFCGKNSLVIYMLQGFGFVSITFLNKLISIDWSQYNQAAYALIKCIIVIIVCSFISIVINKYCPFITGGRK